ncbi:MAG: synthase delta subunit [Candidatus Parcubacteria bacterium]|jgi:F0F1-type ATP synthase delta subunit
MSLSLLIAKTLYKNAIPVAQATTILAKYNLQALLPSVAKHLLRLHNNEKSQSTVRIESPFPVSEASVSTIKKMVGGEKEDHTIIITPELLAGFRAVYKNTMHDASAKRIVDAFTK